jgi:hypothetical protein
MAQHWAKAPIGRNQIVLFSPTLEAALNELDTLFDRIRPASEME